MLVTTVLEKAAAVWVSGRSGGQPFTVHAVINYPTQYDILYPLLSATTSTMFIVKYCIGFLRYKFAIVYVDVHINISSAHRSAGYCNQCLSVRESACESVCSHAYLGKHIRTSLNFCCTFFVAMAQSSSGGIYVSLRCVLPVLWMVS